MEQYPLVSLAPSDFPPLLHEIPDAPTKLYKRGILPWENAPLMYSDYKLLCVVGSRNYSSYGKEVTLQLIKGLSGYPLIIVSGLAIGIDGLAHNAALDAHLPIIAVPGSGLAYNVLYPRQHRLLAEKILSKGGCLLSEFEPDFCATKWSFLKRNRIMAGMSHATLIIEASEKSGTLVTARLAMEYDRDVLTVPGSIFSKNSFGPHMLIREGATPVTSSADILEALGFKDVGATTSSLPIDLSQEEKTILSLLHEPLSKDSLIRKLPMTTSDANILLSLMELKGLIREENGIFHGLLV